MAWFGGRKPHRLAGVTLLAATALIATACSAGGQGAAVTVQSTVTVPPNGSPLAPAGSPAASPGGLTSDAPGALTSDGPGPGTSGGTQPGTAGSAAPGSGGSPTTAGANVPGALPDGFVPTRLKPGEKPPQFVVVSFDGSGWHEKWQYWFGIEDKVPFHFTANLTGLYLLDGDHKVAYHGPGHGVGKTSLGSWNAPADTKQEILDLNAAYQRGDEIGSHFNGHFCSDNPPGADVWTTADWNSDLDQFFKFWKNYQQIDQIPGLADLQVPASSVISERTPCLEGKKAELYPAIAAHGFTIDESFTHRGISWPKQNDQYTPGHPIWEMGMAEFPMHGIAPGHGANHFQITMDYNFWFTQENASNKVSPDQSAKDAVQTQATYQDMLDGAMAGSHAPLLLGNHFEEWDNNAYTLALGNFVLANCGKPGIYCVPFRDVAAWMQMQDPAVLKQLQDMPPVLGPPGSNNH